MNEQTIHDDRDLFFGGSGRDWFLLDDSGEQSAGSDTAENVERWELADDIDA